MAEGRSGTSGIVGVIIGALIVILVGGGILYATGTMNGGGKPTTVKVVAPKADTPSEGRNDRHDDTRRHHVGMHDDHVTLPDNIKRHGDH